MFDKVTVALPPSRLYTVYVAGERVEITGTIDGYTVRMGSARWDGKALGGCSVPLRADVVAALTAVLRERELDDIARNPARAMPARSLLPR
jgi:hypothetical protein